MNSVPRISYHHRPPRGLILYEGPSRLDGSPIVAIATFHTHNRKTGDVIQTWILRQSQSPWRARITGCDTGICGNCPIKRWCYVDRGKAPNNVHTAWTMGQYPAYDHQRHAHHFSGQILRLGSYGDPTAVPVSIWRQLEPLPNRIIGYTHQTGYRHRTYQRWCMASVESRSQAEQLQSHGWRTFRILPTIESRAPNEIICPASPEGGKKTTCNRCGLCHGTSSHRSVAIVAHGRGRRGLCEYLVSLNGETE